MAKKRKRYLVTADKSEAFACSLVTSPAMEETFVAFNEDTPIIEKFADDKKHMITGVVAIPSKPIYRRNKETGEEYDIVFSAEAIEKMSMDFLKNYKQHEVTLQHQENADGVYLVEQWIKNDMVYDKSLSMGLSKELPVGSWFQTYYVDSNDVWKRIESGELLGFSLECALSMEEFNKIDKNYNDMENDNDMLFSKLTNWFTNFFKKQEDIDVNDEPSKVEHLEEETPVVEETPTVAEEPNNVVETPSEPSNDVDPITTPTEEKEEPVEPTVSENKPFEEVNHLEELVNSLKAEIEALKDMNTGLQDKIKDLGKQPSANPINVNAKPNANDTYSNWREQMAKYL